MNALPDKFKENRDHLIKAGILSGPGDGFSMRQGRELYYLSKEDGLITVNLDQPTFENDQTSAWLNLHRSIFQSQKGINVLIQSHLPYTLTAARAGKTVPPLLDDFAQLVGVTVRVATGELYETGSHPKMIRKLKLRNAVLIQGICGLCTAGTFDDAVAVAQVLEKNCRALVYSSFLGGGNRINFIEAWLMRLVYRYKYSRTCLSG